MSEIDWWDAQSQGHIAGHMLTHAKRYSEIHPGRMGEVLVILRRHATAWAKECRESKAQLSIGEEKIIWRCHMRTAEAEITQRMSEPTTMPMEQAALI
jgi:hypothetical protein